MHRTKLTVGDAFVGYQEDTPAAVVLQAYHHVNVTKKWKAEDAMSEEQKDEVNKKYASKINLNDNQGLKEST